MSIARQGSEEPGSAFYRYSYHSIVAALLLAAAGVIVMVLIVLYQLFHRPLPPYSAITKTGQIMQLTPHTEPSYLSSTLTTWASKAAVAAYTFDFVNYNAQISAIRSYFTDTGWQSYQNAVAGVIDTIVKNQLFVNGVVSAPPVISNQGDLPGQGYTWRIQIPFLVTYQSAQKTTHQTYTMIMTIVKVPTTVNPQGIGIEQIVM